MCVECKHYNVFSIVCCLVAVLSVPVFGSPGSVSGSFLNYSPSPRGSAMADAFSSISDDAYSSYYNPAGLVNIDILQIGASYNKSFENITNQFFSIAYPKRIGEVLSFSYSGLSYGEIQGYDAQGVKTKNIDTGSRYFGVSFGKTITKDEIERSVFSLGANVKYISEKLDSKSANTLAFDIGTIYSLRPDNYWLSDIPAQEIRFSALVRNLGLGLKFDKTTESLPLSLSLGISWHLYPWGAHRLILSEENVISNYDKLKMNFGAEYLLYQLIAFRIGYGNVKYIGSKFNFGFGFKLSFVDVDYSMAPFGDLGTMHKFAVMTRFGNSKASQPLKGETARVKGARLIAPKEKIERLSMFAKDYIDLAQKNISEKDYVKSIENLEKAFNLEPERKKSKWGKIYQRLIDFERSVKLKNRPEKIEILKKNTEQSDLANEAIKSYIYLEDNKAFLMAHIQYGTNVNSDAFYEEIMRSISDLLKMSIRTDEILPKDAWIIQKLKKSASYFYVKQYAMVVRECEDILLIDEKNHIAWSRLGSAYFMLGDKDKAKYAFEKAVEINKDDYVTIKFMKSQGWR